METTGKALMARCRPICQHVFANMRHVSDQTESLKDQAHSMHEEARMVLPGIQALFGFQLIAVFNRPFFDLGDSDRALHLASLILVGIAIGLVMAPAAHHRLTAPVVAAIPSL